MLLVAVVVLGILEIALRNAPLPPRHEAGQLAYLWLTPTDPLFERDDDLLFRLVPGAREDRGGFETRVNQLGFRGPEPSSPQILVIGDEAAFGSGVAEDDAWPAQVARRTGREVLNASVPGYSSLQAKLLLERLLARFQPEVVVVSVGLADARACPISDAQALARASRPAGGSALLDWISYGLSDASALDRTRTLTQVRSRLEQVDPRTGQAELETFLAREAELREILGAEPSRVSLDDYRQNLREIAHRVAAAKARLVLVGPVFGGESLEPDGAASRLAQPVAAYRDAMRDVAREVEAAFVSLPLLLEGAPSAGGLYLNRLLEADERPVFAAMPIELRVGKGVSPDARTRRHLSHPSAKGHALIAAPIADLIGPPAAAAN